VSSINFRTLPSLAVRNSPCSFRISIMSEHMALPLTNLVASFSLLLQPPKVRDCIYDAAMSASHSDLAKTVPLEPGPAVRFGQPLCSIPTPFYRPMSAPFFFLHSRHIKSKALEVHYGKLSYRIQLLHMCRN
jgi:hypothetical protein